MASFSPDGRRILTASWLTHLQGEDRTPRLLDSETGRELLVLRGHKGSVWSAAFSPDGRHIVTASRDGTARVWDVETGRELLALIGHEWEVFAATFSPDGRRIVTLSNDFTARVWRRVRPEWWWGIFWLPQFWAAVLLAAAFAWSLRRDYIKLMRQQPS